MRVMALLLLVAIPCAADERPVPELLASEEPREQAWGAYRAASERVRDAVPALRRLLAAHRGKEAEESRLVRETVLDSLIRLKANVPWKELEGLPSRDRTRVLILLAQHPGDHVAALRAIAADDLPELEWLLVCNLLCRERAPGFAAFLLAGLELTLEIKVHDPQPNLRFRFGARSMTGRGDGRLRVRPGWPPRAHYSLSKYEYEDRVLIAPGPHPIYYLRKEVKEGVGGVGGSSHREDRNRFRIEYLAALMGTPVKAVGLRPRSFAVVLWKDEASYLAEAWKAHARIYRAWDGVVESLRELELLTEDEAKGLRPVLATVVEDERDVKHPPLPELPG